MTSRTEQIKTLRDGQLWDIVVIGGGATGLGTALEAATRGYRTLLLEAHDFAKGTSSRSTKLIHGGVRYLANGQVHLVHEALIERRRLLQNAPHLVHPLTFLIPTYSAWSTPYYGAGLWLYDRLGRGGGFETSRMVSKADAIGLASTLNRTSLRGGVVYQDGQFDDARLAIALLRSIDDHGGTALNGFPVSAILKNPNGKIAGVYASDSESSENFTILAKSVINATGVFADDVRRLDDAGSKPAVAPSQGAHIVVDRRFLPGNAALIIPKTDDGRVLFAIPWHERVLIGTTDTPVPKITVDPKPLTQEVEFLLSHAARYLDPAPRIDDIRAVFAGLRPLVRVGKGSTVSSRISREHAMFVSDSGMVTITGGKWTTYRKMGQDAVDLAVKTAGLAKAPSITADLKLHGWVETPPMVSDPFGVYGSDSQAVQELIAESLEMSEQIDPALPYRKGELLWAIRHELARTVDDLLARRTRSLLLDARAAWRAAPYAARLLERELGLDPSKTARQLEAFQAICSASIFPSEPLPT